MSKRRLTASSSGRSSRSTSCAPTNTRWSAPSPTRHARACRSSRRARIPITRRSGAARFRLRADAMAIYELNGVRPTIGERVFIAPSAAVIGDVVLGESASVWFGAVIRGDVYPIRIGARTNIQDNAVVHVTGDRARTFIGDEVTVGHLAIVHGCTIGDRCLIGMGSVVLDGAVVEDECLVGAGSLVVPGTRVPARSLVIGRPARVLRRLEEADLAAIRAAAEGYVVNAS